MRGAGPFLKKAGRKFVGNLLWMLALFGTLGAMLIFLSQLPLLEVATLVGICVSLSAALITGVALWDGTTPDDAHLSSHNYPGPRPEGSGSGDWHGGRGDGDGGGGGGQ